MAGADWGSELRIVLASKLGRCVFLDGIDGAATGAGTAAASATAPGAATASEAEWCAERPDRFGFEAWSHRVVREEGYAGRTGRTAVRQDKHAHGSCR
ncbi:MAG: hypothetical protein GY906_21280 [bacterium]|nr:hypothetical protein [bacterium]